MNKPREASEESGLRFQDFIQECVDGKVVRRLTFEQWKRKKYLDQFSSEYMHYCSLDLIQMIEDHKNGKPHQSGGNFYDWLTDVKGIELTLEETEMRIHKPEFIPKETLTE